MEPNLKTALYVVPAQQISYIAEQTVTPNPDLSSSGNLETDMLIAGIRSGRRVQAMTTLSNGTVVIALNVGVE
jgi:hypothetical protein